MQKTPAEYTEQFIGASDSLQQRLSLWWRPHANRYTTICIAALALIALVAYFGFIKAPSGFPAGELILVEDGVPLTELAQDLERQGVVRSAAALRAVLVVMGEDRSVRAGDYLFKEPRTVFSVARALAIGAFGLEPIRIRVPEGSTARSMAILFKSRLLRFDEAKFLTKAQDAEGFLFPDTYFFLPNATEDLVFDTMRQNFDAQIEPYLEDIESSGRTLEDIVTMASIIEREAHDPDDRRLISGVLWNRIDRDMALQVDAVFLYQLGKSTFDLTLEDLKSDSPYNTYVYKGLPPTPIGSPSIDSIQAALYPTENAYLFYLADMQGVTHYSRTYEEHLRKKRLYLGS